MRFNNWTLFITLLFCFALTSVSAIAQQTSITGPAGSVRFGTTVRSLPNGNVVVTDPSWVNENGAVVGAVYLLDGTTGAPIIIRAGNQLTSLPNGNVVVTDPLWVNENGSAKTGAVYLFNGATGALISTLTGSHGDDSVGDGGVTVLPNGNFVVTSSHWKTPDNKPWAGAVTFGNASTGVAGVVSASNSLIGELQNDQIGSGGIVILATGNYLVRSPFKGVAGSGNFMGAVTLGNGTTGITRVVSSANSLVGSGPNDQVGSNGVIALTNGNYVVSTPGWDNPAGPIIDAGALTFGSGITGIQGAISTANSLVGSKANDKVSSGGIVELANGNYLVRSPLWDNPAYPAVVDLGAITWSNGSSGVTGAVTSSNSLVGSQTTGSVGTVTVLTNGNYVVGRTGTVTWCDGAVGTAGPVTRENSLVGENLVGGDQVGSGGVVALTNGNYVVLSPHWNNPANTGNGGLDKYDVGAVTWCNGATGRVGNVTPSNSLVGRVYGQEVGMRGITVLTNGNYVVPIWNWVNPADGTNAGAVTWCNGTGGTVGLPTAANSLIGTGNIEIGGVVALTNGNYVVRSQGAGAVTWCNGSGPTADVVSSSNSLIRVGGVGAAITALSNGNYVVRLPKWIPTGEVADVGAVTWGNGSGGTVGPVSPANSLVGSTAGDQVGSDGVVELTNGNYIVRSQFWDNPTGSIVDAGAATWCNSTGGTVGPVTSANSLVGTTANDGVGSSANGVVAPLTNGNYVVYSKFWDDPTGPLKDAGAISYSNGNAGIFGPITAVNSVRGTTLNRGDSLNFSYDSYHEQLAVGRPYDNKVTFFRKTNWCAYSIAATSGGVPSAGGSGLFTVNTTSGCSWNATSNDSWISITSGASGADKGTVNYSAQPNAGAARSGTITAAGKTFTVNQALACYYSLSSPSYSAAAGGGSGLFTLTTSPTCGWTAVSNVPWITINGGSSGTMSGDISFSVAPNTSIARTGTITAGGQIFTVNQSTTCSFSLSSPSTNVGIAGGSGGFSINTVPSCTWTAVSNDPWITVTGGSSGSGSGNISFSVPANSGPARTGTITAGGQSFTVNQANGCTFSLSSNGGSFPAIGAMGSFNVIAGGGCAWNADTASNWIAITSGSGAGNGSVAFTVQPNTGAARSGTINVAGLTYSVSQPAACEFSFSSNGTTFSPAGGAGGFNVTTSGGCVWTAQTASNWILISSGSGTGNGPVLFNIEVNNGSARSGTITIGTSTFTVNQLAAVRHIPFDFDGDGKADVSVFRPPNGTWYLNGSFSGFSAFQFGVSTDRPTPADFTGDGKTDIAVFRPSNGTWYVMRSEDFTVYSVGFGISSDLPVPGDYDGDGKADIAVYRASVGTWYLLQSTAGFAAITFGIAEDKPTVGDFDGDGKTDIALYRSSTGYWYRLNSSDGSFSFAQFGAPGDISLVMDYDGDGKANLSVFRPSSGTWYIARPTGVPAQNYDAVQFGTTGDIPAPGDYDGDGKSDVAVFRPSDGNWYLLQSTSGFSALHFGAPGDKPTPSAFVY